MYLLSRSHAHCSNANTNFADVTFLEESVNTSCDDVNLKLITAAEM